MTKRYVSTALMGLLLAASPAAAVPFSITDVDGAFVNPVPPAPVVTIAGSPGNNPTARWGGDTGQGQSGYNFAAVVPPVITGDLPPSPTPWFLLGNFTHLNNPVFPPSLDSIGLDVILDFTIGMIAVPFNNVTFSYTLTHDETTNSSPCPAFQQSAVACDDKVTVSAPSAGVFNVDATNFTLELGFSNNGGATILNQFITTEGLNNTAGLWGRFSSDVTITPFTPVPEPASMVLLGSGLLGLAVRRRRRR